MAAGTHVPPCPIGQILSTELYTLPPVLSTINQYIQGIQGRAAHLESTKRETVGKSFAFGACGTGRLCQELGPWAPGRDQKSRRLKINDPYSPTLNTKYIHYEVHLQKSLLLDSGDVHL